MKLFVVSFIAIMVSAFALALNNDPDYASARKNGAEAKIELHVVEEDGKSVCMANVNVFMGMNFRDKGYR